MEGLTVAPDGTLDDVIDRTTEALALVEPLVVEVVPDLLLHATTPEQGFNYAAASDRLADAWASLRFALTILKEIK